MLRRHSSFRGLPQSPESLPLSQLPVGPLLHQTGNQTESPDVGGDVLKVVPPSPLLAPVAESPVVVSESLSIMSDCDSEPPTPSTTGMPERMLETPVKLDRKRTHSGDNECDARPKQKSQRA